jgi:hypothetical protein
MLPGGWLLAGDLLIVPVRFAHGDAGIETAGVAYAFRFSAGRIVSLTEYRSLEDALRDARPAR